MLDFFFHSQSKKLTGNYKAFLHTWVFNRVQYWLRVTWLWDSLKECKQTLTQPTGMRQRHYANITDATLGWSTTIYRSLFMNLCHIKLTAEQYSSEPYQWLNTPEWKKNKIQSLSESHSTPATNVENLKDFGMQSALLGFYQANFQKEDCKSW